ncbi:MAG: TldD/PmbA family protein [Candidatus Omnitrophica bacterium]|nr:TldD/PmbA family protein [Candidatus Omnitrophota bacterium]
MNARIRHLIESTVKALKRRGVDYADIRWVEHVSEGLVVQNGQLTHVSTSSSEGFSVRVLHKGLWGYAASSRLDARGLQHTADQAIDMARAIAAGAPKKLSLQPLEPVRASYQTPLEVDPFRVELQKKIDYLMWANQVLKDHPNIKTALSCLEFHKTDKLFCSTEGSLIEQKITESGGYLEATAILDGEVQRRSYPTANCPSLAQAGYEYVKSLDFVGQAARIRQEAVSLLRAKLCPTGTTTVILMPDQLILQLHESCGHPVELDRVLGMELSFAGGSFLTPDLLDSYRYGSKWVNITADATFPMGCGTFGYDDEGIPAQRVPIIREGIFVGYLSSRETAAQIKKSSTGAMRAEGWNAIPLIRMTNVNLEPGAGSLQELIGDTKEGILLATNKSWSIDDRRLNFQFGTEIAWEIKNGRVGQPLKNPFYTGITPEFWRSCSGVAGKGDWQLYGVHNCAKGEPVQIMHVGHGASPARFEKVQVGSTR